MTFTGKILVVVTLIFAIFNIPTSDYVKAQFPCGEIEAPGYFCGSAFRHEIMRRESISNCDDPFTESTIPPSPYTLKINGQEVISGGLIIVPIGGTNDLLVEDESRRGIGIQYIFKHEEEDYIYLNRDETAPTEEQYFTYLTTHFTDEVDRSFYQEVLTAYFGDGPEDYFYDEEYNQKLDAKGLVVSDRFNEFFITAENTLTQSPPPLRSGTYTLVIKEQVPILSQTNWLKNIQELLIKTAYADEIDFVPTYTITFTILEGEVNSASSVLFLPGIQASRLYKEGLLGEDQLWEPSLFGGDIEQLELTENSLSVNDIYTKDVIDNVTGVGSIYGEFLDFLEQEKSADKIKDFQAFAYDWRFDVYDVIVSGTRYKTTIKSVIETLQNLADNSHSGKVNIVAHSNGGLLAKALMTELESQGLSNLVDKIVFVAVPQLGTPKAMASILHGYDQGDDLGGVIMSATGVREVMNNMSGAYGLLPSERYFEETDGALLKFENGSMTTAYGEKYGTEISDFSNYKNFLIGSDGLERDLENSVATPVRLNESLLTNAFDKHKTYYDSWLAPDNVQVIEIIGYGLPTVAGIEYRTLIEKRCATAGSAPLVCVDEAKLKPFIVRSNSGDGTVLSVSAEAYQGDKEVYYLDLFKINDENIKNSLPLITHANLTELSTFQNLLADLLKSTTTSEYDFVSQTLPQSAGEYDVHAIDSPVALWAIDSEGNRTGAYFENGTKRIVEDIKGSQYQEIGDTKYIYIPSDIDYRIELLGEDDGGYTLTVAYLNSTGQQIKYQINNATTTPDMVARYNKSDDGYSEMEIDMEGDGIYESKINLSTGKGTKLTENTEIKSNKKKSTSTKIKKTKLNPPTDKPLTSAVYEKDELLRLLIEVLIQYRDMLIKLKK